MKVLVTGAAGQLGREIVRQFQPEHTVVSLTRRELNLTDHTAIGQVVNRERPDWILNCAAFNDVDGAEDRPTAALEVNAMAVKALARAAASVATTFVHYSTDFVFDGEGSQPYTEEDPPGPRSVYAMSKLLGEWLACDAPRRYILRVESLFGGPAAKSSTDRIADAILAGKPARVFHDRTVSPSYVVDVASATRTLLENAAPVGLYHCVNSGSATWAELAEEVGRVLGTTPILERVSVADVVLRAKRPRYCVLSNAKLAAAGVVMPSWQDALRRYLKNRNL
jgi:dTDP-4-dehydrorhamnose reductase